MKRNFTLLILCLLISSCSISVSGTLYRTPVFEFTEPGQYIIPVMHKHDTIMIPINIYNTNRLNETPIKNDAGGSAGRTEA